MPDVTTFGTGLGGGLPLSAAVASAELMDLAPAFAMMTTSGNPVSTAAGAAVVRTIEDEGLVEAARQRGELLRGGIEQLARDHTMIGDVRGRGLAVGVDLVSDRDARTPAPVVTAVLCSASVVEVKPATVTSSRVMTCTGDGELNVSRRIREPVTMTSSSVAAP